MYNTVVQLCQFFVVVGKLIWYKFSCWIREFLFVFLALYGSTTIQSRLFLKNIKNYVWFHKQYLLSFFILEKFWTGVSCFSVTLFYSTLLDLTHSQNDGQRLKYTRFAWAGGTFFPVVLLCQFSVLAGKWFWFYILPMFLETIQLWCCVNFFNLAGNSFWNVRT